MTCPGSDKPIAYDRLHGQGESLKGKCPVCKKAQRVLLVGSFFKIMKHEAVECPPS